MEKDERKGQGNELEVERDRKAKERGGERKINIRGVWRARGRKCGEGREEIKRKGKNKARDSVQKNEEGKERKEKREGNVGEKVLVKWREQTREE